MFQFLLPDIGEGLEEAEIVEWLVEVGDVVVRDQPLVEVLTDKASSELPSPVAGRVAVLGGVEGQRILVGQLLIEIDDGVTVKQDFEERETPAQAPAGIPAATPPTPLGSPPPFAAAAPSSSVSPGTRPKAAPATRKFARDLGVDLTQVPGSGPGGRILLEDVQSFSTGKQGGAARSLDPGLGVMPAGRHPLRGVRGAIARNMAQSWSEIPHIHSLDEIDASVLLGFCQESKASGMPLTPLGLTVAALARALRRFPMVNGHINSGEDTQEVVIPDHVNIGVAVATETGLVVPVIKNADHLNVAEICQVIADLAQRGRSGSLSVADLSGGTFTVTNYGSLGGRWALPIIPPGQSAIWGMGRIADRPLVVDGRVVARPALPIVMGADHRLVDGDLLEAFRHEVLGYLVDPQKLLAGDIF